MKKFFYCVLFLVTSGFAHSIDFPVGGDYIFRVTNPDLLSSAGSSAGGAFFSAGPTSIIINPALTANDQRIMLNLGYTALFNTGEQSRFGSGVQLAVLVPSHWGVFSGTIDGIFCDVGKLQIGNILNIRGGFSKDITDRLYVGVAISGGARWISSTQWHLALDLGAMYRWGDLGFLKDTRFGATLTGLGKPYELGAPSIVSPKIGMAATLFSVANENLVGGFSADLSFPMFMNMVLDAGLQLRIAKIVTVKGSWQFDIRDTVNKNYNLVPVIGVTVRFGINTKKNQFMIDKGWQQSEITTSGAWQNMYEGVHAVSAGAAINLGLLDTESPEITVWEEK